MNEHTLPSKCKPLATLTVICANRSSSGAIQSHSGRALLFRGRFRLLVPIAANPRECFRVVAGETGGTAFAPFYFAVSGLMTALTSEMRLAGNPLRSACSRIRPSLAAL